jgi:hypothetical protein
MIETLQIRIVGIRIVKPCSFVGGREHYDNTPSSSGLKL